MTVRQAIRARVGNLPTRARLRAFGAALRGPHRRSACRAAVDGVLVTLILRVCGVRPLLNGLPAAGFSPDPAHALAVSAAVDAGLGILPLAPTCLRRSITLLREFGRRGLDAGLHIGVRAVDDRIEAHAWVQVGELVVNDDPEVTAGYQPLADGRSDHLLGRLR